MSKMKRLVVVVKGVGRFPMDMARYDRLVPESSEDAHAIEESLGGGWAGGKMNPREISLVGWIHGSDGGPSSVTKDRWESFGWKVVSVKLEGKEQKLY
jgi:hypothetical protein